MPTTQMCATCLHRTCDRTAILFKLNTNAPDFSESSTEAISGSYCEQAAWVQIFHALRTRGRDYIGGEVRAVRDAR